MGQVFRYPNLLAGTRSKPLCYKDSDHLLSGVRMRDGVVGDYQRVTLDADAEGWAYVYMTGAGGIGDVPEGTELSIFAFVRVNGGPRKLYPSIRRIDGLGIMHDWGPTTWENVGGGGPSASRGRRGMQPRSTRRLSTSASHSTRPARPSTSPSRWPASPTSRTHGRLRRGRCGRR